MKLESARGIALEFGKSPRLWPLAGLGEVSPKRGRTLLVISGNSPSAGKAGGGGTRRLLWACRSLQRVIARHEQSPEGLTFLQETHFVAPNAQSREPGAGSAAGDERVLFVSWESPERWSKSERSSFESELDVAIDFLSALEPSEDGNKDPPKDSDADRPLELARQRRDQLLRDEHWLNGQEVHVQQGGKPDAQGANNTASRLRRGGVLLGAWNGREYVHPAFQFHSDTGRLMDAEMKVLLAVLPKDKSGWRQSLWLFQRHGQLDGRRPTEVFQEEPEAVIAAARSDFESSDERW